jgi:hypothetical protein
MCLVYLQNTFWAMSTNSKILVFRLFSVEKYCRVSMIMHAIRLTVYNAMHFLNILQTIIHEFSRTRFCQGQGQYSSLQIVFTLQYVLSGPSFYFTNKAVNRGDKRTRRVRDRDFVKYERSRRYRDHYRCQEK